MPYVVHAVLCGKGTRESVTKTYTPDDLLLPLALTVIIDRVVRDDEHKEFCHQAAGLLELNNCSADASSWFKNHAAAIGESLSGRKRNTFILKALSKFRDDQAMCEALYDAMLAISISDQEYHRTESDLVKTAASLWGFQRPPFKVQK